MVVIMFSSCSSSQKLQEKIPFTINSTTSQKWVAGVEAGGSGTDVVIYATGISTTITLDSLYFRGKKGSIEAITYNENIHYKARFKDVNMVKPDIIMHADPKKEFGNQPPPLQEKIPFELKEDEAILLYHVKGKAKYFKITGIKELETLFYPSSKPQSKNEQ